MTRRSSPPWACAIAVTVVALVAPSGTAFADEPGATPRADRKTTSSLSWVRLPDADECISGRELGQRVERRLGRPVFESTARAELAIEGRVERLPGRRGYRATVTATRADGTIAGERRITAPRCAALDDEVVLIVALMIDPTATRGDRAPPVAPPPPLPPPEVRVVEVPGPERPSPPWKGHVTAGPGLVLGLLPGLRPSLNVSAGIDSPSHLGFVIDGAFVWPFRVTSDDPESGASLDLSAAYAGLMACLTVWPGDAFDLAGCAGPRAGIVHAAPSGVAGDRSSTEVLVNAAARLRAVWRPLRPLGVELDLGPELPFLRHCFAASSFESRALAGANDTLACTGRAGAMGWLGFGVALP